MTETLFMIYSAAAAAVTLWLLGGMAVGRMRRRRRRGRDAVLQRKYLHIVMLALFSGGEETPRFPLLRRAGARRLLIETVGRDGGFIMCTNTVLDEAKPELVRVWVDAVREFGAYH